MLTKISIAVALFFSIEEINAQENKDGILQNFNHIEYYPDSTIKAAYHLKRYKYTGYAIEFDSIGNPEWIGKYKNDVKHGSWLKSNARSRIYKKGEADWGFSPGCGNGVLKLQNKFQKRYTRLTT